MEKRKFTVITDYLSILLPKTKYEYLVLLFSLILYYPIGVYLSLTTDIIDKDGRVDMYFGFDNSICLKYGSMFEVTHPINGILYFPIICLNYIINAVGYSPKIYTLIVVFLCAFFVSYSNLFVYKYLTKILKLNIKETLIIIFPYTFYTCNLLLSFTPETFTFSLFLLSLNIFLVSYFISNNKKIHTLYYVFIGTLIGGQTITNTPKAMIPILFENKLSKKNYVNVFKKLFISSLLIALIILASLRFRVLEFLGVNMERAEMFAFLKNLKHGIHEYFISQFFGGNILFPKVYLSKTNVWGTENLGGIYSYFYDSWTQYLCIFAIIIIMLIGIFKNYKSRLIWIPVISFGVDFFLHMILKLGLFESIIYGGHFIFIVPILLGWSFYRNSSKKYYNILCIVLSILGLYIIYNNTFEIIEFVRLAQIEFPH
ncbi:hypothetical protein ETU08_08760 [Apibacter muscae]|uniref:Glycosyltransferase RgtA/B/C/D-like domain-containing protein n=1 Tax=Apibacter muscae TaxID=2509004 RepID=A0A563DC09_9FLAO|nr:DUF6080 domain-containing protein [Apibacter muscae]TWP27304.1 hypothetical protein ETU09_07615 [Apibacter muscae]TWP28525.1 hypothetical protein ETU08_08760 [Apibacter muscae]